MVETPEDLNLIRRPDGERPSEHIKAAALAALLLGMKPSQVAKQYGISTTTAAKWERDFDITNPIERQGRLGEMFLTFMEQELISLTAMSIATSDEDWVKDQTAAELAVFWSARKDLLFRLMEALGRKSQPAPAVTMIESDES